MSASETAPFAGYELNEHQLEFFDECDDPVEVVLEAVERNSPVSEAEVCEATGLGVEAVRTALEYLRAAEIVNADQTPQRAFYEVAD